LWPLAEQLPFADSFFKVFSLSQQTAAPLGCNLLSRYTTKREREKEREREREREREESTEEKLEGPERV
jgi:ribosomal protein L9